MTLNELGEDSELAYMTDEELLEEWLTSVDDKEKAILKLSNEIAYEQYVPNEARRRQLKWSR